MTRTQGHDDNPSPNGSDGGQPVLSAISDSNDEHHSQDSPPSADLDVAVAPDGAAAAAVEETAEEKRRREKRRRKIQYFLENFRLSQPAPDSSDAAQGSDRRGETSHSQGTNQPQTERQPTAQQLIEQQIMEQYSPEEQPLLPQPQAHQSARSCGCASCCTTMAATVVETFYGIIAIPGQLWQITPNFIRTIIVICALVGILYVLFHNAEPW